MKRCSYCGLENPDEAIQCATCHTDLAAPDSPRSQPQTKSVALLDEQRFWERITFRQFAVLLIRFQSLFFLAYAIDNATYIPASIAMLHNTVTVASYKYEQSNLFWSWFRVAWHLAAFVALILYADKIARWLIRDTIPNQPPNTTPDRVKTLAE